MKFLFTLPAIFFSSVVFAQTAPDFTITATDGQSHSLYADYLEQGQTVVIEMMFTTCPPCNAFAPYVEPMNEHWGSGQFDVQFLALSTQHFDNNASVGTWLVNHGVSFPGAGKDGGAVTALQPYLDGDFGPFFGTPAFIVIAPDGSVNFNVGFGLSGQAKADAINDAIATTGAKLPPVLVHVTGTVTMPNGKPIPNVAFSVGHDGQEVFAADTLDFFFEATPGLVYTVVPSRVDTVLGEISTFDMVLITKHILGVEPLTPLQLLAADVNASNSVTTLDLVDIRKWILGIDPISAAWIFVNAACDPANDPGSCAITFTVQPDDTEVVLHIFGIRPGDVNYSTNP